MSSRRLYELAAQGDQDAKKALFRLLQREGFGETSVGFRISKRGESAVILKQGIISSFAVPLNRSKKVTRLLTFIKNLGGEILHLERDHKDWTEIYLKFENPVRYGFLRISKNGAFFHYGNVVGGCLPRKKEVSYLTKSEEDFSDSLYTKEEIFSAIKKRKKRYWDYAISYLFLIDQDNFPREEGEALLSKKVIDYAEKRLKKLVFK